MEDKQGNSNQFIFTIQVGETNSTQPITNTTLYASAYASKDSGNCIEVLEVSKDEAPLKSVSFEVKLLISLAMMTSLTIGSYFKSIMYRYVSTTNKNNRGWMQRPINVLIITSAVIHHSTHLLQGLWYIVFFLTETPLKMY